MLNIKFIAYISVPIFAHDLRLGHILGVFPVYFSALILSLSQQMTSDRINLYATSNATLW